MSITTLVKSMQDIMRKDVGVDGDAQRIAQIVWMIFLKILDDKEQELELIYDHYQSPIPERFRWRQWAANEEGMTGDELLAFIDQELFPALSELQSEDEQGRAFLVREVFQDSYNYMKSGTLIRQVLNKINGIDFNSSEDRHLFNDFYEKFLKDLQSAGNAGEYYTPRAVTQFMVDMTNPQLGEKVLDPATGTGGFLASTVEHLKKQAETVEDRHQIEKGILGIEKKPLPYVLCVTNLILHDIEVPNVHRDNSLSTPLRDIQKKDQVDVVVTNPPFGGEEEDGIQTNFPASFKTKETADLFIALIMTKLKDHGRAAVVLPDGFLFGEGVKTRLKEQLVEECDLHTIVRLPNGVFNPYTGIKTNLLFFEKGSSTENIWYFDHPYPEGQKSYSKTKPMRIEEFDLEKQWWSNRKENEYAWKVSIENIRKRNYNLDISNPYASEEEHLSPEEAYERYQEVKQQVVEKKDQLKKELISILEGVEV